MSRTDTAVFIFNPEVNELKFKTPRSTSFIVRRRDIWEELVERTEKAGVTDQIRGRVRFSKEVGEHPVIYDIKFRQTHDSTPLSDRIELGPR